MAQSDHLACGGDGIWADPGPMEHQSSVAASPVGQELRVQAKRLEERLKGPRAANQIEDCHHQLRVYQGPKPSKTWFSLWIPIAKNMAFVYVKTLVFHGIPGHTVYPLENPVLLFLFPAKPHLSIHLPLRRGDSNDRAHVDLRPLSLPGGAGAVSRGHGSGGEEVGRDRGGRSTRERDGDLVEPVGDLVEPVSPGRR